MINIEWAIEKFWPTMDRIKFDFDEKAEMKSKPT